MRAPYALATRARRGFVCGQGAWMRGSSFSAAGWLAPSSRLRRLCYSGEGAGAGCHASSMSEPIKSLTREEFTVPTRRGYRIHRGRDAWAAPLSTPIPPTSRPSTPSWPKKQTSIGVVGLIYEQLIGGDVRTGQASADRSGRLLGDRSRRRDLHVPSQSERQVARWHRRDRR